MPQVQPHLPIITIDGSSGAGKGTLTSQLAKRLDYAMLDSGALYRIVGLMAQQAGLLTETIDEDKIAQLTQSLEIGFLPTQGEHIGIWVNGQDLTHAIRTEQVGEYASKVAVFAKVRIALLDLQRNMAMPTDNDKKGLIADGRDMGTVVFPNADLKIYLVASAQARAERRVNQLSQAQNPANHKQADFDEILAQIVARDERDSSRSVAPAKPADDAIVIDSSQLSADDVFDQVLRLCVNKGLI